MSSTEELLENRCGGEKRCLDRESDIDSEECRECLREALDVVFAIYAKDIYEKNNDFISLYQKYLSKG